MANPLNRERKPVSPNVVPASFTPVPEQFAAPVTQELRTRQVQMAQGYALGIINELENQLHKGWYKRSPEWQEYPEAESNNRLIDAIRIAKTARTIMLDRIFDWAGNYSEEEMANALPTVWYSFVEQLQNPTKEVEDTETVSTNVEMNVLDENALAPEDMEPVQVINRPVIPDDVPKSEVVAPEEPSLGDILGKISEDNSKD